MCRFVHFTRKISSSGTEFSALYGSVRVGSPGLYTLSLALEGGAGGVGAGLYVYPGRLLVAGCPAGSLCRAAGLARSAHATVLL